MRNVLLAFVMFLQLTDLDAQLNLSVSKIYSSPLEQFYKDDYQTGWGNKFGVGFLKIDKKKIGREIGFSWLWNSNGTKTVNLDLGEYTLKNKWYNWQFKYNYIFKLGAFKNYAGFNIGGANYSTTEYLDFKETQFDGREVWRDKLHETKTTQFGIQAGSYIELNKISSLDIGFSVLNSIDEVDYINFESFTFDGESIDYQEPKSTPFIFTINLGWKVFLFGNTKPKSINNKTVKKTTSNQSTSRSTEIYENQNTQTNSTTNRGYPEREERVKKNNNCSEDNSTTEDSKVNSNSSSSSSSSGNATSSKGSKSKKSAPKLYKNGKTPVSYK